MKLPIFSLSGPSGSRNFCEGEGECTSEMDAGQFSIFGAVEENDVHR